MDAFDSRQTLSEEVQIKLAQKRKALDVEIEKFMAQKDAEFRRFEREVKNQLKESPNEDASGDARRQTPIVTRGFNVEQMKPASIDIANHEANVVQSEGNTIPVGLNEVSTAEPTISKQSSIKDVPPRESHGFAADVMSSQIWLPLLQSANDRSSHHRTLSNDESSWMSTSLDTQGKQSDAERPSMAARRSSSSPTGLGRSSRKSSLKRPDSGDSTPRKHVLFSIDNQVISPSSSPVKLRSAATTSTTDPPIPFSGLRDLVYESQRPEQPNEKNDSMPAAFQSKSVMMSTSPSFPAKSYKDLVEPTAVTPPEELKEEDLHSGSKDPLFGVDEPPPSINEEEWNISPVEIQSNDEDDIIAASPHTGSLPIRIRHPY